MCVRVARQLCRVLSFSWNKPDLTAPGCWGAGLCACESFRAVLIVHQSEHGHRAAALPGVSHSVS